MLLIPLLLFLTGTAIALDDIDCPSCISAFRAKNYKLSLSEFIKHKSKRQCPETTYMIAYNYMMLGQANFCEKYAEEAIFLLRKKGKIQPKDSDHYRKLLEGAHLMIDWAKKVTYAEKEFKLQLEMCWLGKPEDHEAYVHRIQEHQEEKLKELRQDKDMYLPFPTD